MDTLAGWQQKMLRLNHVFSLARDLANSFSSRFPSAIHSIRFNFNILLAPTHWEREHLISWEPEPEPLAWRDSLRRANL